MPEFSFEVIDSILIFKMDKHQSPLHDKEVLDALDQHLQKDCYQTLIVVFGDDFFLSSQLIGKFISIQKNRDVVFVCPRESRTRSTFDLTGLDKVFTRFNCISEAMLYVGKEKWN